MSRIVLLPSSVSYEILGKWLTVENLAQYDTALCCQKYRPKFLEILRNDYFVSTNANSQMLLPVSKVSKSYMALWFALRSVKIDQMVLHSSTIEKHFTTLCLLSCGRVNKLTLLCGKMSQTFEGKDFFEKFTNLKSVVVQGAEYGELIERHSVEQILIQLGKYCPPNIESLCVTSSTVSDAKLQALLARCGKSLKTFEIPGCHIVTEATSAVLMAHKCNLTSIDLSYCGYIYQTSLPPFIEANPNLTHINLEDLSLNGDCMTAIATHCKRVKWLNVDYCRRLPVPSIAAVFHECKELQYFATMYFEYCNYSTGGRTSGRASNDFLFQKTIVHKAGEQVYDGSTVSHTVNSPVNVNDSKLALKGSFTKNVAIQETIDACPSDIACLDLHECHKLNNQTLIHILSKYAHCLTNLDVSQCKFLTDEVLVYLGNHCHKLQYLNMSYCDGITESSVKTVLQKCNELSKVQVLQPVFDSIPASQEVEDELAESITTCRNVLGSLSA